MNSIFPRRLFFAIVALFIGFSMIFESMIPDPDNVVIQSIGCSMIASVMYFFAMDFWSSLDEHQKKKKKNALIYRQLQLLLVRLDSIFLDPYEYVRHKAIYDYYSDPSMMRVEDFYDISLLRRYTTNFNLQQESMVQDLSGRHLTFYETIIWRWKELNEYANKLISLAESIGADSLIYEVSYLIEESTLKHTVEISQKLNIPFNELGTYFNLNYSNPSITIRTIDCIINLHRFAYKYYESLRREKHLQALVHKPSFYREADYAKSPLQAILNLLYFRS